MASARTSFAVSYDLTTKIVSSIVAVTLLAIAAAINNLPVAGLSLLVILLAFAYSPRGYEIADGSITVKRLIGNTQVSISDIHEARRTTPEDLRGCIRLWGSGGLFGYYGLFRTSRLGRCTWYATNRKNFVVLVSGSKTTLYSPDNVDGFLGAILVFSPVQATSAYGPFTLPRPENSAGRIVGVVLGVTVATASIAAVVFGFMYSPGTPAYTLTADALTIHDRFYPVTLKASSVDVSRVRVVDLTQEPEWRTTRRTNGFANTRYRSGWFRVENGKTVRLYQTHETRLVLLPPLGAGAPVLYEAKQPGQFAQEVRDEWARNSK